MRSDLQQIADNGPTVPTSPGPWQVDREQILREYLHLLERAQSPLLASTNMTSQLTAQLYSVIDSVAFAYEGVGFDAPDKGELSEAIGRDRAAASVHPSQSLHAAALIFEAALPKMARRMNALGDLSPELTAGRLLNKAILDRMALAARAYVDLLLDKAHGTNRDERRRLSRELHDVAAPAVAMGLQNLELFELYVDTDQAKASEKLAAARQSMRDALTTIRNLSAESRENVGVSGLEGALRRYLSTVPTDIRTELTVEGDLGQLSLAYSEELYLIVREAVRNAVDHARPSYVAVSLRRNQTELCAQIRNDGMGFAVQRTLASKPHVGLTSMQERTDLLGARLRIKSTARSGTTVSLTISLAAQPETRSDER